MSKVLKSIELEDGRVLKFREGMPSIDTIVGNIDSDITRFNTELDSPYCSFDRKEELESYINDFEMAKEGWLKLKEI